MRLVPFFVASLVIGTPFISRADSRSSALAEVVIADEIRIAFYEYAPGAVASELSKAVRAWCSSGNRTHTPRGTNPNDDVIDWLCKHSDLSYYRNVYVTGHKGGRGLVCRKGPRYMGIDMVDESIMEGRCVAAMYDGKTYLLDFGTRP